MSLSGEIQSGNRPATQSLSNRPKFSVSPSVESPCHGVRDPPSTWIFWVLEKLFSQKTLAGQNRVVKKGGQGRVERVQEMGETVETVLGLWYGIQVHSVFHTVQSHFFGVYTKFVTIKWVWIFVFIIKHWVKWGKGRGKGGESEDLGVRSCRMILLHQNITSE